MQRSSLLLSVGIILVFTSGGIGGAYADNDSTPERSSIPMEQLRAFAETYWQIKQSYIDPVDDKKLIESAINGMLQSLDPYSSFLDEHDLKDLQTSANGSYDGLGVEISTAHNQMRVVNILDNSPASRAGIRANDLITVVNDFDVSEVGTEKALEHMSGSAGDIIQLHIQRDSLEKPLELSLVLETLEQKSVSLAEFQPGFWHAKISIFQRDTGYELANQFRESTRGKKVDGVVLDLRNNPGGVLRAAVDVADLILTQGVIVSTEGRAIDSRQRYYANPGDEMEGIPVIVLINEGSASASEIVAGALQDHNRAAVVGQPSYGKGLVQSVVSLRPNMAIKLTTSRYFTPSGRSIHDVGILPDVDIEVPESDENVSGRTDIMLNEAISLLVANTSGKL